MSLGKNMEEVGLWRRMLTRAQQGDLTNHNFFSIRVVEGYLQTSLFCVLGLPRVFMEHYRSRMDERVTLEGADGQQWLTMLGVQLDLQYCLNLGWKEFAQAHNLALNDQIVFLLFEDSHFLVQVFDANNNFKGRGGAGGKGNATSLAEKTKDVPIPGGSTFLFCDHAMEIDRIANEAVIEIHDSSEEDGEEHIKAASDEEEHIKMRPKQTVRSAAEDQRPTETAAAAAPPQKRSRSPPTSISAPSSPELAPVLKRVRKLRGYDEDEDYVGPAPPPAVVPAESETPSKRPKRDAALSVANKLAEMMAAEATNNRPRSSQKASSEAAKKRKETPPKGMKTTQPVSARPKMKVQKKRGPKASPPPPPPPSPPSPPSPPPPPQPEEAPKAAFKRPAKIARLGPQKAHKIIYISKRRYVTDQERKEAVEKAEDYVRSCKNRHYVMQLRVPQVYCGYHLAVLSAFVEALELPLRKETMTFYDVTGKTWEVDWQGDHPEKPGFNSRGWTKFVLDHYLEEGDVCVFELPDPKEFNISVTIFPVVKVGVVSELGWKAHYGGDHEMTTSAVPRSPVNNRFAVPRSPVNNGFAVPRSPVNNGFAVPRSPLQHRSPLKVDSIPTGTSAPSSPVNDFPSAASSPVKDVPSAASSPMNVMPSAAPSPVNVISSAAPSPMNVLPSAAPSPVNVISSAAPSPMNVLPSAAPSPVNVISSAAPSPMNVLPSAPPSPMNVLPSAPPSPVNVIPSAASSPVKDVPSAAPSPVHVIPSAAPSPVNVTPSAAPSPVNVTPSAASSPVHVIPSAAPFPVNVTPSAVPSPVNVTPSAASSPVNDIPPAASSPVNVIPAAASTPVNVIRSAASSPVNDIPAAASSPVNDIPAAAEIQNGSVAPDPPVETQSEVATAQSQC